MTNRLPFGSNFARCRRSNRLPTQNDDRGDWEWQIFRCNTSLSICMIPFSTPSQRGRSRKNSSPEFSLKTFLNDRLLHQDQKGSRSPGLTIRLFSFGGFLRSVFDCGRLTGAWPDVDRVENASFTTLRWGFTVFSEAANIFWEVIGGPAALIWCVRRNVQLRLGRAGDISQ